MAFNFDKVKDTLVNAGKEVGDKAKEASAIAKIKVDIKDKEKFLEKQYAALGRAVYEAHKDEEDAEEQTYFAPIKEAEEEIARLKEALLDATDSVVCPACGSKQPEDNAFCSDCGAPLK